MVQVSAINTPLMREYIAEGHHEGGGLNQQPAWQAWDRAESPAKQGGGFNWLRFIRPPALLFCSTPRPADQATSYHLVPASQAFIAVGDPLLRENAILRAGICTASKPIEIAADGSVRIRGERIYSNSADALAAGLGFSNRRAMVKFYCPDGADYSGLLITVKWSKSYE